jgi:hypothetical protein
LGVAACTGAARVMIKKTVTVRVFHFFTRISRQFSC